MTDILSYAMDHFNTCMACQKHCPEIEIDDIRHSIQQLLLYHKQVLCTNLMLQTHISQIYLLIPTVWVDYITELANDKARKLHEQLPNLHYDYLKVVICVVVCDTPFEPMVESNDTIFLRHLSKLPIITSARNYGFVVNTEGLHSVMGELTRSTPEFIERHANNSQTQNGKERNKKVGGLPNKVRNGNCLFVEESPVNTIAYCHRVRTKNKKEYKTWMPMFQDRVGYNWSSDMMKGGRVLSFQVRDSIDGKQFIVRHRNCVLVYSIEQIEQFANINQSQLKFCSNFLNENETQSLLKICNLVGVCTQTVNSSNFSFASKEIEDNFTKTLSYFMETVQESNEKKWLQQEISTFYNNVKRTY